MVYFLKKDKKSEQINIHFDFANLQKLARSKSTSPEKQDDLTKYLQEDFLNKIKKKHLNFFSNQNRKNLPK